MPTTEVPVLAQEGTWDNAVGGAFVSERPRAGAGLVPCWRFTGLNRGVRVSGTLALDFNEDGTLTVDNVIPGAIFYGGFGADVTNALPTLTLGVSSWPTNALPATLELYLRREATPGSWDADTKPGFLTLAGITSVEPLGARLERGNDVLIGSERITSAPTSVVIDFNKNGGLGLLLNTPSWDGSVNLYALVRGPSDASTVTFKNNASDTTPAVLAATSEAQDFTGVRGLYMSRAYRCDRCGRVRALEQLVRDGEQPALRVCPETCYDVEDDPHRLTRGEKRGLEI